MFPAFTRRGCSVLRCNFRGVGRSQGRFARGEGELADAAAALDWLQAVNTDAPVAWVGGFSFGAWIGMQLLMRRPEINGFISVAPPANAYDFKFLAERKSVVQGKSGSVLVVLGGRRSMKQKNIQTHNPLNHNIDDAH